MRILRIRFKNLNSLVGEWEIDLTHPAFSSDGIFAITGPTGAGKTTLLDAICLGLYGRTPRLSKVTKSGNEVMSRQTGECFAEVTFETRSGRYRCHWSQHRARKKAGGELQAPKHEISDAVSGRILETRLREVAEEIEIATGMDFDRFTRSMLLAQGDFAAFLQAAPDERAPILEQITGTGIYSQISIRVHEKHAGERKKLDALQAEFAGMQLLSAEEEQLLKSNLRQKILLEKELETKFELKGRAIAWREGIGLLEKELILLAEENRALAVQKESFEPELRRLERARQALEFAGSHAELVSLRGAEAADHSSLRHCHEKLPQLEAGAKQAEAAFVLATENQAKKKGDQSAALGLIRKVRELDLLLKEKETPIRAAMEAMSATEKNLEALRTRRAADCHALDTARLHLDTVQQFLTQNVADAGLVEALAGIRERFNALRNSDETHRRKMEELAACAKQQQATHRLWEQQKAALEKQKKELSEIEGVFSNRQRSLGNLLDGAEIPDFRNKLLALKDRKALLEKLVESVTSRTDAQRVQSESKILQDALLIEKERLARAVGEKKQQQSALERELPLLETQLSLLRKIQDFEAARHQLQDGEPCPLCGAEAHPYAMGNLPVPDETLASLKHMRAALKKLEKTLSDLLVREAKTLKDLEQAELRQTECSEQIKTADFFIAQGLSSLRGDPAGGDLAGMLRDLLREADADLQKTMSVVKSAEKLEKEIAAQRRSLEKMKDKLAHSAQDTQAAAHNTASAWQTLERVTAESSNLTEQLRNVQEETLRAVSPYGIERLPADLLNTVLTDLTARRDRWLDRQKRKTELEKNISILVLQTEQRGEEIKKLETALKEKREAHDALLRDAQILSREREEFFGKKDPDTEENRLAATIEEAQKQLEAAARGMNAARQELVTLGSQIEALGKAMALRSVELKTAEVAFLIRLTGTGFSDEADYLAACLTGDERASLTQKAEALQAAQTGFQARFRDKTAQLQTEREKMISEKPLEALMQEAAVLQTTIKEMRQTIGGIQQQLQDNDSRRLKQLDRAKAIEAQKKECTRWEILHALIGSADGKRYRNFAQGLTFEIMIGHANRQLQQMTDRYLLIRDEAQPLELNVIDNYQAGEIRSTKNLSGGESFIVSLSLALGLSFMASKNVRVDSLFLDEGFGTLDEEALDMALETLSGLHQNGKLIGVISHVPALKERISSQIQLIPLTGGRSVISGPGCERADQKAMLRGG
ncbi:MAG: AAA family ATPase [Pseudomonadota bacterium]